MTNEPTTKNITIYFSNINMTDWTDDAIQLDSAYLAINNNPNSKIYRDALPANVQNKLSSYTRSWGASKPEIIAQFVIDNWRYSFLSNRTVKLKYKNNKTTTLILNEDNRPYDLFADADYIVSDWSEAFSDCTELTKISFENMTLKHITSMRLMCARCSSLVEFDFGSLELEHCIDLHGMFKDCVSLERVLLSNEIGRTFMNVIRFNEMFYNCYALKKIDMSMLYLNKITTFEFMFQNCTALVEANVNWRSVDYNPDNNGVCHNNMFNGCKSLETVYLNAGFIKHGRALTNYKPIARSKRTYDRVFHDCGSLKELVVFDAALGFISESIRNEAFKDCVNLETISVNGGTVSFMRKGRMVGT